MEEEIFEKPEIDENWYYVIIQDPATSSEQYVGFSDDTSGEKFIPLFKTKDDATQCFKLLPKDIFNGKYAVQAVIEDDLFKVSRANGHTLYLLDGKGAILEIIKDEIGDNN